MTGLGEPSLIILTGRAVDLGSGSDTAKGGVTRASSFFYANVRLAFSSDKGLGIMLDLVVASISLAVGKTVEVNTETRRQSRRADRCPSSTPHGLTCFLGLLRMSSMLALMMDLTIWVRWLLVPLLFLLPELQTPLSVPFLFILSTFLSSSVWKLVSGDPITVSSQSK